MTFTRSYPLAAVNYSPGNSPMLNSSANLTIGSSDLTGVPASHVAAVTVVSQSL